MKIVMYGPGCARYHETERVVRHVVEQLGITADVEKVSVDGVMKLSGRIPKAEEVHGWLAAARG
jgi:hypothetical protein